MKRGNQMIKKLSVAVFSMIALTTLGLSSALAAEYLDENEILDTTVIVVAVPNELTVTTQFIDENGVLETTPITIEQAAPVVVNDENYPYGV